MRGSEIVLAVGTRPEAIKVAGIVRELGDHGRIIHTGQHYDRNMWKDVLADLPGVEVDHHVSVGGRHRGEQIGKATELITQHLVAHPARALVVQGDTNSTLAGALAANAVGIPVIHVEAGLRSHDRSMPEEINRLLVDAVADLCCAPTAANAEQLASEGVGPERVLVTGNTLADAMTTLLPTPPERARTRERLGLPERYVLSTVHRAGTVDDAARLGPLLTALAALAEQVPVVLPLHPHTRARVEQFGLQPVLDTLTVLPPLSPRDFLGLEADAALLLSDSGGVQEEACLLRRPLLVLRDSTERPELLAGWCRLLGDQAPGEAIAQAWRDVPEWTAGLARRPLPYGQDGASARIVAEIDRRWPAE